MGYYDYVFRRAGFYGLLYESQAFVVLKVEIIGSKPMAVVKDLAEIIHSTQNIEQQNQWHLMTVDSPQWEKYEHEYNLFETEVYNVRYYHFQDFLEEANSHIQGKKDILSPELQLLLNDEDTRMGYGVFMYDDLLRHCETLEKKLISDISHAGIYSIKSQLDRIEKILAGDITEAEPSDEREQLYEETTPIQQIFDDFMWDYGCIFSLRDTVRALTNFGYTHIPTSDIRIFYLVC